MPSAIEILMKQNPMLAKGLIYQTAAERSLVEFIKLMWEYVEPARPFVSNWHIDAIAEHLEAVSHGQIRKLLINIPPGFAKSLLSNVFYPAWDWIHRPHIRYIAYSYSSMLTERDNIRFKQVIESDLYRALWGDKYGMSKDRNTIIQVSNDKLGWKMASSIGGGATGHRGDVLIIDDPNSVKEAESKSIRESTNMWFNETLPTRVNSPQDSAMVVIQQRTNEGDVSGNILASDAGSEWTHLCLPMHFDPERKCTTLLGWEDPRTEPGELLWPEVYGEKEVDILSTQMGSYATSGQFEQMPSPRGGGIIKDSWWRLWPKNGEAFDEEGRPLNRLEYPEMDFIIGSIDSAYTEKQENDPSAMVVLGVYREYEGANTNNQQQVKGQPRVMLMDAWSERLPFHGIVPDRRIGESERDYLKRDGWGLVERAAYTCHKMQVDRLLIENKASGISLGQELRRLYSDEKFGVMLINPKGDKVSRAHAVSHLIENGVLAAPNREWSSLVIQQCSVFPKGRHDDLVDALTMGLKHLRDTGWALRTNEYEEETEPQEFKGQQGEALYDV